MKNQQCVEFLRWALPHLGMRWQGFRKVRRQVCRRIAARMSDLRLGSYREYRELLQEKEDEWSELEHLCRVTISRYCRDREFFNKLGSAVLPTLVQGNIKKNVKRIRCWSAGCASGEEPYSLALVWHFMVSPRFPSVELEIFATDTDTTVLERSAAARYSDKSLREVPDKWREEAFRHQGGVYVLKDRFKKTVRFFCQDIRRHTPGDAFDLILCRNLAFTYFNEEMQEKILAIFKSVLRTGGALGIGAHEALPEGRSGFNQWPLLRGFYISK